jgi:hypothetical protein
MKAFSSYLSGQDKGNHCTILKCVQGVSQWDVLGEQNNEAFFKVSLKVMSVSLTSMIYTLLLHPPPFHSSLAQIQFYKETYISALKFF